MGETFRKTAKLIEPGERARWLLVVVMAVLVSAAEALSTIMVFGLLALLSGEATGLSVPVIGDLRSYLPSTGEVSPLPILGLATAAAFLLRSGLILVQHYVQYRVAQNAGARLSSRLFDGYLAMPYRFHLQRNSSELVRNAFDSVQRLVAEGFVPAVRVLAKVAIVVGVVGVLLAANPVATLFAVVALAPLTWGMLHFLHPRVKRLGRTAQEMAKQNLQMLQQGLHGWRDITVLGREETFVNLYRADRSRLARARYLRQTAAQAPRLAIESSLVVFIVVFVWVITNVEGGTQQALPMLGLFGYAAARLMPEIQQITQSLNSLKFVGPAVDDIAADLDAFESEGRKDRGAVEPLPFRDALTFENVRFRYPGTTADALTDVNVTIRPGQSIGIVGPTGGGKSTFVDLLLALLQPTEGRICVDGLDVTDHPRAWQTNIGSVPQMVFLVDDTLRRNIALGVPDEQVDEQALAEAVRMAQLEDFIARQPHGLDTIVGERGVRVSGGQRQRVAIARALYQRPNVLVFDEGTSALDTDTESALMEALEGLRGQRTLVTVAHRLTTVERCDTVLLIREGRIVDRGHFAELASRHAGLYRSELA